MVRVDSLHGSLWECETVFWLKHAQEIGNKFRTKLRSLSSRTRSASDSPSLLSLFFAVPMSVVTTLEASDWSVQLRPDAISLQSKEPLCRAVAGALSASVQQELPRAKEEQTTTVKLVPTLSND